MAENTMKRASLFRTLVVNWVRLHRPDVMDAAHAEAEKKYPHKKKWDRIDKAALPESLVNLK